jgi:hypothetical protein
MTFVMGPYSTPQQIAIKRTNLLLEGGPSGGAKERETKEVRKRASVHMGKAMECISQILHRSYLVAPASRRSFTMAE